MIRRSSVSDAANSAGSSEDAEDGDIVSAINRASAVVDSVYSQNNSFHHAYVSTPGGYSTPSWNNAYPSTTPAFRDAYTQNPDGTYSFTLFNKRARR